jgi:hypothetical protein
MEVRTFEQSFNHMAELTGQVKGDFIERHKAASA